MTGYHIVLFFFCYFFYLCVFLAFSFFSNREVILLLKKETNMNVEKRKYIYMLQRVHSVQTNTCVGYKTNKQTNKQKHLSLAAQFRSVTTYEEEEEVEVGRVRGAGPPSSCRTALESEPLSVSLCRPVEKNKQKNCTRGRRERECILVFVKYGATTPASHTRCRQPGRVFLFFHLFVFLCVCVCLCVF